jgi:OOP family OmpA-OmpF porin
MSFGRGWSLTHRQPSARPGKEHMFEHLVNDASSRLNVPAANLSAMMRELLWLVTNDRTGGPEGFLDQFRRAGLGDATRSWFDGREGQLLTTAELESALGTSTLDHLAISSGLSRASAMSAVALLLPTLIGRLTPGSRLAPDVALPSQVTSYLTTPDSPPQPQVRRMSWQWLPWTAWAVLSLAGLLLLRGTAGTINPQLTLTNRDGLIIYSGLVRDDASRRAIVGALQTTFGAQNVNGHIGVDRHVRQASWMSWPGDLFGYLKVPGVDFSLNGDAIGIGGWLSAAERQTLTDRLRAHFGPDASIGTLGDAAADAVRAANDKALSALSALPALSAVGTIGVSGGSADSLVRAMNLAIINFATASADIPADGAAIIRKSAEVMVAMRAVPAGTMIEIGVHTDSTGDPAGNLALSQQRADAVKHALVAAGVPAAILIAKGYGATRPRATNDTEYGRFLNRRIVFAVIPKPVAGVKNGSSEPIRE